MRIIELIQDTDIDGTPSCVWHGPRNQYVCMDAVTEHPDQRPGPEHVVYEIEGYHDMTSDEFDQVVAKVQEFKAQHPAHLVRPSVLPGYYQRDGIDGDEGYWYAHRVSTPELFCEAMYDPHDYDELRYVIETNQKNNPMTFEELSEFVVKINEFFADAASHRADVKQVDQ